MSQPAFEASQASQAGPVTVWALWDASELLSLHATRQGALDAREAHLHHLGPWAGEEQAVFEAAAQVIPTSLEIP